jgi:hypothetical protein
VVAWSIAFDPTAAEVEPALATAADRAVTIA